MTRMDEHPLYPRSKYIQDAPILPVIEQPRPLTDRERWEIESKEISDAMIADRMAKAMRWVRSDD